MPIRLLRFFLDHFSVCLVGFLSLSSFSSAQTLDPKLYNEMHWRQIGPTRAGRARALSGVPSQPNVFYIGFDNGGVWRSTDYGSTWQPLFDSEATGSIGAIAVAPSNPDIIYVGTGAGIIRPDLAVGEGIYKSVDAGKTWTSLGLHDSQMIANIEVDPSDPNRLFVAVLGHPYGPNAERGVFRSTDGGASFEKVLYKDEYTSANDVRIDSSHPNIVYATLWQQQQGFYENQSFGGDNGGIFKSTDGGTTWTKLTAGLPEVAQANLAIAPSRSEVIYAMVAVNSPAPAGPPGVRRPSGSTFLYKSSDGGATWSLATGKNDPRPLIRIGGGDLPTVTVDPKNPDVVYSCSTVLWRTDDAGTTWTAVRGAPGGDDYQKTWINPNNPDLLLVVSDQGGVISANHGRSWSNWYNQPTAAMYHVTADNAFPYRLCGGQQDSGSACVDSRGMDGEITFHDWHPVDIEEYGMAAPDPKNPDLVYGGKVSLYDRATGQKTNIGPPRTAPNPAFSIPPPRMVRTQPLIWSPKDPHILYAATSGVWKTLDGGRKWEPISGDLTRQTWNIPDNAGKYKADVKVAPVGTVTALAPSPVSVDVIWAGTGDGLIQLTTNGGLKWTNVTPPPIKPWTRIFNMDAGHFDAGTAYAAANTLRLDDVNPHLWRTHDGGKTWAEIDNGIPAGAVANSIREDPHKKGLLFASTDTQVWISIDDGDHWNSLRLNMPAISVRDIQIKDDKYNSDLVAGTHGRGFWILDDITPFRQAADASSGKAVLFKPVNAVRVRFDTNDPTPWPPEMAAGENPPNGAIIDYALPSTVKSVKLEVFDDQHKVVRTYQSSDVAPGPQPATDPEAYNKICQQDPKATDCGLPLYWPAPPQELKTTSGMHRFLWDMHYDPIPGTIGGRRGGDEGGAVPHRTAPPINAPWAPPGRYTVVLTVDGESFSQPLSLLLDPRVKVTPEVEQMFTLTRQVETDAHAAAKALQQAQEMIAKLRTGGQPEASGKLLKQLLELAPPAEPKAGGNDFAEGPFGAGPSSPSNPPTLTTISGELVTSVMSMQGSELPPTATEVATCTKQLAAYTSLMNRWSAIRAQH